MKYFLHDTNARNDEKITLLFINYGYEAIGLFYSILEILASQEKPVNEKVLKSQLNIKKRLEKQLLFMYEIEILYLINGDVFNENILNFSEKYQIKKEKTRNKVSEWREKQRVAKNVTSYVPECNDPKVKESKVKESKEEYISKIQEKFYHSLEVFINDFDKKTIREFYDYWSEPNKSKTKIRYQLEKTWDTKRRLQRWTKNNFNEKNRTNNKGFQSDTTKRTIEQTIQELREASK